MQIIIAKDLYPISVVLKSAYVFTDRAYLFISQDAQNYIVNIEAKEKNDVISEQEFKNELLSQAVRHQVFLQTKDIRELIVSRALASTIVDENNNIIEYDDNLVDEDILKDWFAQDENSKL